MKYAKFTIPLALLIAMGCSDENPVFVQDNKMVRFAGSFSGRNQAGPSASLLGEFPDELISLNLEGSGQFAHIGHAGVVLAHCAHPQPFSSDPLTLEVLMGKIVITGADGDEIYVDYWGSITYSEKVILDGEFNICGGGGRFAGAQGDGSFVCEMTGPDNDFSAELTGKISSPRSSAI